MIDLHTHILPGVDDGARTLDDALEMALAFVADGVTTVAATPHVRDDYPTSADVMLRGVDELRRVLEEEGIPLTLLPGAELAVDRIGGLDENELRRLTLTGSGRYLLVETPYFGWPPELAEQLLELRLAGFTPVLAHPERNAEVQATPSLLTPLVHGGTLVQITAASLDGRLGALTRQTAFRLLEGGLAHMLASDAHMPDIRAVGMQSAADTLADPALAEWLLEKVPRALVEGRSVPPRQLAD
ncbi:tyrosine protein phosphatase [soil metagenome]